MKKKNLIIKISEKSLENENTMKSGDNCGNGCASGSDTASDSVVAKG